MNAERARIQVRFPVFVERLAPVTGESGMLRLDFELDATVDSCRKLVVTVAGQAMSLCPCSKETSNYGAHNQRCRLSASVRFRSEKSSISIDDLFQKMEQAASCSVYATVKRSDEKRITEAAYDNPKFIEDTVRDLALNLKADPGVVWFRCESESYESIHQHNAFARIEIGADGDIG